MLELKLLAEVLALFAPLPRDFDFTFNNTGLILPEHVVKVIIKWVRSTDLQERERKATDTFCLGYSDCENRVVWQRTLLSTLTPPYLGDYLISQLCKGSPLYPAEVFAHKHEQNTYLAFGNSRLDRLATC
ncbi:hypothetical protein TNCT_226031 [Trichonephila clavata]|uniref:Uncharacterized protein n=1 Tax=Trichonephila clavata TaxID=2740835 RepID=A0A8X6M166_TRICU|nr:hypothetical protein TNCT_226031 [Trichonephila clavata]